MINLPSNTQILWYTKPIDMRKGINGLTQLLAEEDFNLTNTTTLFIFSNRKAQTLKCIFWDKNGFVLLIKRLEKGRFRMDYAKKSDPLVLSSEAFQWLMAGLEFEKQKLFPELSLQHFY